MRNACVLSLGSFIVSLWLSAASGTCLGQNSRNVSPNLPTDETVSIPSPDGHWALIASPIAKRTIVLENRLTDSRSLIKAYDRSLKVGWSPDSRAFYLNDAYGSNLEDAFVYWVDSKDALLLNDVILSQDKEAKAVLADHSYFHVLRWQSADLLLVEYCGHGGDYEDGKQFDLLYDVELRGLHGSGAIARRVSRKIGPLSLSVAECRP